MSRMWMVPARWLCREHLLGEHSEMHQIAGTLLSHDHGQAVVEGLADDYPLDTGLVRQRHAELAAEMEARGFDHDSELRAFDDPGIGDLSGDDVRDNLDELCRRCPDCAHRYAADGHRDARLGSKARFVDTAGPEVSA